LTDEKLIIEGWSGWKGLIIPDTCYILFVRINKIRNTDDSSLIHRIPGDSSQELISQKVESVLNSTFFIAIIEAYLGEQTGKNFIGIQLTWNPSKTDTFLIEVTKTWNITSLNHCPRTSDADTDTETLMVNAIRALLTLLLYVSPAIFMKCEF
jgi:hypothetical protein